MKCPRLTWCRGLGWLGIPVLLVGLPQHGFALDEEQSLGLLVSTLDRVDDEATQAALLQGMMTGLAGRREVPVPAEWERVGAKLARSANRDVRELASQLSQLFGDEAATQRAFDQLQDRSQPVAVRKRALHSLLTQKHPQVSKLLEALLEEPQLQREAIRGYASAENPSAPRILLQRYTSLSEDHRKAVLETLATRKVYALALLEAIQTKQIPRSDVPAHVARSLNFLLGNAFAKVFGNVRQVTEDRAELIAKYKELLTEEALARADAAQGRLIYNKTCASCHVLYGTGAKIGPDLTGSNRGNIDYLLLNSVDPSYDVPEGYRMVNIQTVDGRVLSGVIAEEDGQRVVLKTVEQPTVIVLKRDIEVRQVSPKSMMPDGQLEQMKPQDILHLVKYLQTIEQVELPE